MRLHPVCPWCQQGDHEDCVEELSDGDVLCSCIDEYHYEEEDAQA